MSRLAGRVALVFGAGSAGPGWGNGKAAAVLYAREGARIMAVDLNRDAAEETARIIGGEGGDALAEQADVTQAGDITRVVESVLARWGRIDILHNNVGVTDMGDLVEMSEERWRRTLDTNLTSAFLACKHAIPAMLRQGKGAIVNVSSLAGQRINA